MREISKIELDIRVDLMAIRYATLDQVPLVAPNALCVASLIDRAEKVCELAGHLRELLQERDRGLRPPSPPGEDAVSENRRKRMEEFVKSLEPEGPAEQTSLELPTPEPAAALCTPVENKGEDWKIKLPPKPLTVESFMEDFRTGLLYEPGPNIMPFPKSGVEVNSPIQAEAAATAAENPTVAQAAAEAAAEIQRAAIEKIFATPDILQCPACGSASREVRLTARPRLGVKISPCPNIWHGSKPE